MCIRDSADVSPDLDIRAYLSAHAYEWLHDYGSVILDLTQGIPDLPPWSAALSGYHAVALACVEMSKKFSGMADRDVYKRQDLVEDPSEELLDEEARFLLNFEKDMIRKHYGIA